MDPDFYRYMMSVRGQAARNQNEDEEDDEEIIQPTQVVIDAAQEERKKRQRELTNQPIDPLRPLDKYRKLDGMKRFEDSIHYWRDTEPGQKSIYLLDRHEDPVEFATFALETLEQVQSKFTIHTFYRMLEVAYNLKNSAGERLFDMIPAELYDSNSKGLDDIHDRVLVDMGIPFTISGIGNADDIDDMTRIGQSCAFIAASYLRLASKDVDNYMKINHHLIERFKGMYGYDIAIQDFAPPREVVMSYKSMFNLDPLAKNTLYVILYAGEQNAISRNVKHFLYGLHLSYTGMHSVVLFKKVSVDYDIEPSLLARCLHSSFTSTYLKALLDLFSTSVLHKDPKYALNMWRYARVFEPNFYKELQTRYARKFVYILAYLIETGGDKTQNQNAMNIVALREMPKDDKELCEDYGIRARAIIYNNLLKGNYSIVARR